METPAWRRLVVVVMSGLVTFGAGAVAPASPMSAAAAPVDSGDGRTADQASLVSEETADPDLAEEAADRVELPDLRTIDSQTFRNPDGTYTTEYSTGPIFYEAADGSLQPIEAVPVASQADGIAFETRAAAVRARLGDSSAAALLTIEAGDHSIGFRPARPPDLTGTAVAAARAPAVEGGKVVYRDVYPGIDLRYTLLSTGAKEDIILTQPGATYRFAFILDAPGLRASLNEDGSIDVGSRAGSVFHLPAPFMVDSASEADGDGARSNAVKYELLTVAGKTVVVIEADPGWLADPARVYPVYIDPTTVTNQVATLDTFISSGYPSYNLNAQWNPNEGGYYELWNGRYDSISGTNYAFVKTGLPTAVSVTSATFNVYVQHSYMLATPTGIQLGRLTSAFTESQTWNMTHPSYVALTSDTVADNQWANFGVTSTVQSWVEGTATNYGFRIYESSTDQSLWKRLRARENGGNISTNKPPYLAVTWTNPIATAVSPTGAAWTKSSLLDWTFSANGSSFSQTKFQVQVSTSSTNWSGSNLKADSGVVTSSATSWTAPTTNLVNGTTYYWRVKVFDGHSWSAWTSAASFKWDAAPATFTSATVGGAITAADPNYYDLGNGTFTVKIRGSDANSGIKLTYLRLYNATDELRVSHDWSLADTTNCNEFNTSTLVDVTACARTYNSGGTREVQFTVVGLNQSTSFDVQWYLTDYAGNTAGYTDTGKNLIFDATAPTAAITSPAAGSTVSGSVPIVGTASDANFKEYQLHYESAAAPGTWSPIGTNPYGTAVTSGTLGTWNAAALSNGTYTLRLRVYDKARVSSGFTEILRAVTLANGSPLTADITAPIEAGVVEGTVSIAGTASAAVDFDRYELHFGAGCTPTSWSDIGVNPRTTAVTNGQLADWDTNGLAGDHAIRLTVYQLGGAQATDTVCIHVGPRLPEVVLVQPVEATTIFSVETLAATASHESGIASVEFLVDGNVIGTDTTEPYSIPFDTTLVSDGTRELTARATAVTDEVATSDPVSVEVANALPADARVEADFEAGRISADEHAVNGIYALGAPLALEPRYQSPQPIADGTTSIATYLAQWDELSQATRDEIVAFLKQPERGMLYGAVESGGAASVQVASALDCVQVTAGWFGEGSATKCTYLTDHFWFEYTIDGTGDFARDSLSTVPDVDDEESIGNTCANWLTPSECNGIPDYVDELAQGLEDAYAIYTDANGLSYPTRWTSTQPIIPVRFRGDITRAQVLPNQPFFSPSWYSNVETIEFTVASGAPYYLAHHELYHVFQYQYLSDLSLTINAVNDNGPWWWMEATAEWAAGHVARSGSYGAAGTYAEKLQEFLGRPSERWDTFENPKWTNCAPCRQYGAFILAEFFVDRLSHDGQPNPDVIKQIWEQVDNDIVPQLLETAMETVAGTYGTSLAELAPEFSLRNYLLDYDDTIAAGSNDVESVWRTVLAGDARTHDDDIAPARPNRSPWPISDGEVVSSALVLPPGGTAYIELVPPPPGAGELAITVGGAIDNRLHARLVTLRYGADPADRQVCIDTPIFIDAAGAGSVSAPILNECRYGVLIFTGVDFDGDTPIEFGWSAEYTASATPPTCTENFARTVAPGGWGQSAFGGTWVSWQADPDLQASVDGMSGRILGEFSSRLASEGLALEFPVELVTRWRFVGPGASANNYFEIHLQDYDSGRDVSASYSREFIGGNDFSETIANHEGSQQSGTAAVAAPDGAWMWMRVQVTATQTRLRVWADGEVEPITWQRTATGPTLPAPPDLITVFANATNANQGLEVDFITFTEGCAASTFVDPFDRVVDPATGATAGWGTGSMGRWTYSWGSSSGTFAVDGASATHTAAAPGSTNVALDLADLLGFAPRSDLELLVRWRVDTAPVDNAWTFEAYFTNQLGLADDYVGVAAQGYGTDQALINAGFTTAPWEDFYNSAPGYPTPIHDRDMWMRLLVDQYGVYARYWAAGTPEPVLIGGVVPSVGGRGEHWHTYETNSSGIPPTVWEYLEIRVSGGADTTTVDHVELIVP